MEQPGSIPQVLVVVAGMVLAVSVSIVAMPAAARETLTVLVERAHDQASSAGAPTVFLRLLAQPERFVNGLRVVGGLYAVAAGALLLYALT